jgi:hypothetical protein
MLTSSSRPRIGVVDIREYEPAGLDEACAVWDWARTAGISASELREALRQLLAEPAMTEPTA